MPAGSRRVGAAHEARLLPAWVRQSRRVPEAQREPRRMPGAQSPAEAVPSGICTLAGWALVRGCLAQPNHHCLPVAPRDPSRTCRFLTLLGPGWE